MSGIVERLQESSHQHRDAHAIRIEAADEITRLRTENERLRGSEECPDCGRGTYGVVACHESDCPSYEAENERLRAERDALEDEATELRTDNETLAADVMRLRGRVEELEEALEDIRNNGAQQGGRWCGARARRALTDQEEEDDG